MSNRHRCRLIVQRTATSRTNAIRPWTWLVYRSGAFTVAPPFRRTYPTRKAARNAAVRAALRLGLLEEIRDDLAAIDCQIAGRESNRTPRRSAGR